MALKIKRLSARTVATLKARGRHSDGGGLYLSISHDGSTLRRRWVFLFRHNGKLREMGLGGATAVTLAHARDLASKWRAEVAAGRNPLESRKVERRSQHAARTFGEVADALYETKSHQWRNAKVRKQWRTPLQTYASRLLCMPANEITTEDVLSVLQPIWTTKAETASRLRGRIEAVLDAARVRGFIPPNEANPARWRGHLSHLLPKRRRLTRGHHAAMPFQDVPAFISSLRQRKAVAALALEFLILTAARTGEVLGACWNEVDLNVKVWTVPAQRMKGGREHRVPLSKRAVEILQIAAMVRTGELVFPSTKAGRPLSGMAMEMLLRRMKVEGATIHGFPLEFQRLGRRHDTVPARASRGRPCACCR